MSVYNPKSRRAFLQGLGGTMLSIPVLPSLIPSVARAAAGDPALRYLQVVSILGRDVGRWYPSDLPSASYMGMNDVYYRSLASINGPLSASFGTHLDSVRNKVSLLRGLDAMTLVRQPNGNLESSGHHNASVPTTGVPGPDIGKGSTFNSSYGYSVDAVLEENTKIIAANAQFKALRIRPHTRNWTSGSENPGGEAYGSFCWTSRSGKAQRLPAEHNLQTVFDQWFRNLNAPTPVETDPALIRRKFITDLVLEDYKKVLNGRRIASDDKYRLDNYISLVNELEMKLTGLVENNGSASAMQCESPNRPSNTTSAASLHRTAADLVVAAFACGLTRVASHVIHHFHDDPLTPYYDYAHNAAHQHNSNWRSMSDWRAARLSEILRKLDAVPDGNGKTLLDNTIVMFNTDESDGKHKFFDMPVVLAGGTSVFNQGNYIDYRPRPLVGASGGHSFGRPVNQLMVTIFQAMGLTPAEYQKLGTTGFATYGHSSADRYAKYTSNSARNNPLPLLWKG